MVESYLIWSSIITSIATVVLAIVTTIYAFLTGRMINEMKKTREAEIEPSLEVFMVPFGPTHTVLEIRNVGKGTAKEINAEYDYDPPENKPKRWEWSVLSPKEFKRFGTPDGNLNLESLASSKKKLKVTLKYKDLLKREYRRIFIIDFNSVKEGWYGSDMLIEEDLLDLIKKVNKNFENISKSFTPFGLKMKKETNPATLQKIKDQIKRGAKKK